MRSFYLLIFTLIFWGCATEGGKYKKDLRTAKETLDKYEKDTVEKLKSKKTAIKKVRLPSINRKMCLEQAINEVLD